MRSKRCENITASTALRLRCNVTHHRTSCVIGRGTRSRTSRQASRLRGWRGRSYSTRLSSRWHGRRARSASMPRFGALRERRAERKKNRSECLTGSIHPWYIRHTEERNTHENQAYRVRTRRHRQHPHQPCRDASGAGAWVAWISP